MKALLAGVLAVASAWAAEIPRLANGKPDLSGVWQRPYVPDMSRSGVNQVGPGTLPFTDWGLQAFRNYDRTRFDPISTCLPLGLTRSINSPFPIEIVQTPSRLAILYEAWNNFHLIPTDGRAHGQNPDPAWMGTSVGNWDGDTLVVDTIGFNDKTNLDTAGHPHSAQLHVIERFARIDGTHIAYEITIEDPKVYSEPWKNARTFTLRPDWKIMEYSCEADRRQLQRGRPR